MDMYVSMLATISAMDPSANIYIDDRLGRLIQIAIAFALVLLVWILRKKITNFFVKVVCRFLKQENNSRLQSELVVLYTPLQWLVVFIALHLSVSYILPITIQAYLASIPWGVGYLLLIGWGSANFVDVLSKRDWNTVGHMNKTLLHMTFKVVKYLIWALIIVMILDQFGFNINGLIAGLGLGGLAVALAAQDAVNNVFGCVVVILDKPFEIGDWIQTPDVEGIVEEISFRSTRVRTFQNALVSLPNSTIASSIITNWSKRDKRKLLFYVNLTYSTSKEQVQNIVTKIKEYLVSSPDIDTNSVIVGFEVMNSSSLDIKVECSVLYNDGKKFLAVREKINYAIMDIVKEEGGDFAFPSQSVYIESMPK
ncbi:MAG: mechanosensitive ion channel family protein [Erysipelotrichaceae bacterium]|nr:mechanosensitive ion channel family protein [Erysipelotrichaceae bacterium]